MTKPASVIQRRLICAECRTPIHRGGLCKPSCISHCRPESKRTLIEQTREMSWTAWADNDVVRGRST